MDTRNLRPLESVPVREIWPLEDRDFTPWLARNLQLLGEVIDMRMELVQREQRQQDAGQVDLLAREVDTGRIVVIESQLEWSNDDHFARLIGYAASRDADIAVWVATGFYQWHMDIMDWMNKANAKIYAVEVSCWRIGDAVAPHFKQVMRPGGDRSTGAGGDSGAISRYARFYRTLTARLRGAGMLPVGRGGWRGSYRSFRTGYENRVMYALQIGDHEGRCWTGLYITGSNHQEIYDALSEHEAEVVDSMGDFELQWESSEADGYSAVWVSTDGTIDESEERLESIREWMFEGLTALRNAIQPTLDETMTRFG